MKKIFNTTMAFLAAVTLLSLAGCNKVSKEDINPTYDGEAVKTQFSIAFPNSVAKTKMSAATVQNDQTIASFRGMDNIVLYPFAKTGAVGTDPILSTDTKLGGAIALTTMIKPSAATVANSIPATSLLAASNAVLYNDVTIPVGTGSFLFYGKAVNAGSEKFVDGELTMAGDEPSTIVFKHTPTYAGTPSTIGADLATYLTGIARATNWAECADVANVAETWYNASLGDLYTAYTGLVAGSSLDVQAAVQDLYSTLRTNTDPVSIAIVAAIKNATYAADANDDGILEFQSSLNGFPADILLPDGAATLEYTAGTKTFTQVTTGGNTGKTAAYTDYVYPASLYYYANSGIKTANTLKNAYYTPEATWDGIVNDATNGYKDGTSISVSTRSVAILDAIQYAVGRLDATVKTANNTLYDKKGEAYDATAGFTVTGILIGGQKAVGYDFATTAVDVDPATDGAQNPEVTIYDNVTVSNPTALTATTTASAANYTLALETAANTNVFVAVELLNNGADFEGYDGVVPAGCKFYLVAQLDPTANVADHVSDVDNTGNKVFKQDYKTIANFTIAQGTEGVTTNTKGLAAAYNTIPDLRTPKLELGLSVDLTWRAGITFTLDL